MLNSDSQKPSNLEESEEKKMNISEEAEIIADNAKMSEIKESNAHVIRVLQNSSVHSGKYELLDRSIVFDTIRSLYVAYWTLLFSFFE